MNCNDFISVPVRVDSYEHMEKFREVMFPGKESYIKRCVFSDIEGCSNVATWAHSISKSMILKPMVDEGKLIEFIFEDEAHPETREYRNSKFLASPIGIQEASTFPGLCQSHDSLFSDVDQKKPADFNREDLFWMVFRGGAAAFWFHDDKLLRVPKIGEFGIATLPPKSELEEMYKPPRNISLGFFKALNYIRKTRNYFNIEHVCNIYNNCSAKVVVSTVMSTPYVLANPRPSDLPISINIFPTDKDEIVSIISMQSNHMERFITDFPFFSESYTDIRQQQEWLSRQILQNAHNLFLKPSYWNGFTSEKKKKILLYTCTQYDMFAKKKKISPSVMDCPNIFE